MKRALQPVALLEQNQRQAIEDIITDVVSSSLEAHELRILSESAAQHVETRSQVLDAVSSLTRIVTSTTAYSPASPKHAKKLFESLSFATINERYEEISDAHGQTFQWIFNRPGGPSGMHWDDYVAWLCSGSQIYWIYGKAASGKSTLMKYIHDSEGARKLLAQWADDLPLVIASHFFWGGGTSDQRSYKGLLKSLLFQILRSNQDLIPLIDLQDQGVAENAGTRRPDPANDLLIDIEKASNKSWTLHQLKKALSFLINQTDITFKLCLFVDGLDEYEGELDEIARFFRELAETPSGNVKICLSSRPLIVFEEAFDGMPSLFIQELTKGDIQQFVEERLSSSRRWKELVTRDPERCLQLRTQLVSKADGVFLWVKLVVNSLLVGLTNRDSIEDLERRLDMLPEDLERLYSHMLINIKPTFYLEQASRIFQIVRKAQDEQRLISNLNPRLRATEPLTIYQTALAFDYNPDLDLGRPMGRASLGNGSMNTIAQSMADKLKTRCAGLLELGEIASEETDNAKDQLDRRNKYSIRSPLQVVVYIHRTAKDFLDKPDTWATIVSHTSDSNFDPAASLAFSSIALLSAIDTLRILAPNPPCLAFKEENRIEMSIEWEIIYEALLFLSWIDQTHGDLQIDLFEKLDGVASERHQTCKFRQEHWISHSPLSHIVDIHQRHDSTLSLAIETGLDAYVNMRLNSDPTAISSKRGMPLITYAVNSRHLALVSQARVRIISTLLQHGAGINKRFLRESAWQSALYQAALDCHLRKRKEGQHDVRRLWLQAIKLLVEQRPDPEAQVVVRGQSFPAHEVVYRLFATSFPGDARALRLQLRNRIQDPPPYSAHP